MSRDKAVRHALFQRPAKAMAASGAHYAAAAMAPRKLPSKPRPWAAVYETAQPAQSKHAQPNTGVMNGRAGFVRRSL